MRFHSRLLRAIELYILFRSGPYHTHHLKLSIFLRARLFVVEEGALHLYHLDDKQELTVLLFHQILSPKRSPMNDVMFSPQRC